MLDRLEEYGQPLSLVAISRPDWKRGQAFFRCSRERIAFLPKERRLRSSNMLTMLFSHYQKTEDSLQDSQTKSSMKLKRAFPKRIGKLQSFTISRRSVIPIY